MVTAISICVFTMAALLAGRVAWLWFSWRGDRLVTCPETQQPVGVALDTGHVALTGLGHAPVLRLRTCSRWPERQDCGQECLSQIQAAPEGCLVRNILTRWYEGKCCAICGKPVGEIHWSDHRPGLLSPEQRTVGWEQVAPEMLPQVLGTHAAVCWNCHIVQTFCREHPDLVVDRSRTARL